VFIDPVLDRLCLDLNPRYVLLQVLRT